jgi:hypothetical protein
VSEESVDQTDRLPLDAYGRGQWSGIVDLNGERLDCSGMRWTRGKAEPLHLRCIGLNGDWERFCNWFHEHYHARPPQCQRLKILTDQPMNLETAA